MCQYQLSLSFEKENPQLKAKRTHYINQWSFAQLEIDWTISQNELKVFNHLKWLYWWITTHFTEQIWNLRHEGDQLKAFTRTHLHTSACTYWFQKNENMTLYIYRLPTRGKVYNSNIIDDDYYFFFCE